MIVLVCGGRTFKDQGMVWTVLDELHRKTPISEIVHGAAKGADSFANLWARARAVKRTAFSVTPEQWKIYGKAAGPIRNERMLRESKPSLCVAFPGKKGTADMVRRCRATNVEVWRIKPTEVGYDIIRLPPLAADSPAPPPAPAS